MNTEELSNRLTQIVQGITNTHPIRIKATIEVFLEELPKPELSSLYFRYRRL